MKEDDVLPAATANQKKDSSDSVLFGRGRYKFFAFAALMLLAFWSMFTGTVTLRLSTEDLNRLSEDIGIPTNHESLDVLEMEEREKVVKHMWDVYTNSRRIKLPQFWQQAFVAAYEELTSDVPGVRDAAIGEIAKMSVARSISLDPTTPSRSMELATHIGEVVINKCFCTRRNPISISAAAIYLACQLEDKRKTQAEICKITGLTEVTLRKLYKELLRELGRSSPV
uniref:Cyclin-like domain-containing protein n=1 Tax=Brassica campestris TaxID=3711 RepID=M4D5E1_BRACM